MGGVRPTGTLTFMFTDIEGSTKLWDEHPVSMGSELAIHDRLVRSAIESNGGYVFATGGDGFCAAFDTADAAGRTAVALQRTLRSPEAGLMLPIRLRMGIHTGIAEERDGDYFGPAVIRAARIMSIAHGGQIVASAVSADLLDSRTFDHRDLGIVSLDGLAEPEAVVQIVAAGIDDDFPPLRSQSAARGNLPTARNELIGRSQSLDDLIETVRTVRLATLTGAGGVGKTRLALAAGERLLDEFDDGVWLIELAKVHDGEQIVPVIAATMRIKPRGGIPLRDALVTTLSRQRMLLILDNCEHLLDGAARLVEDLLDAAPSLRILATSREGLGVAGERIVTVPSLPSGGDDAPAVRLFVERAASAGWTTGPNDSTSIASLCDRLDGIPLAIELAAARARTVPPGELLDRLNDRFRLLTGGRRAVERHQTLRATVAWSYDLLSADERRLFDRLSVFVGGFDLAAAEATCCDDRLDELDVDVLLASLVDKSMVGADAGRFAMLETLRQFGEERLAESDDPDRFRRAHAAYYCDFAQAAHSGLLSADHGRWWANVDRSWNNLRAAFHWLRDTGDTSSAARLVAHLEQAALIHDPHEPFDWARQVLTMPGFTTEPLAPACLALGAMGHFFEGDLDEADRLAERARGLLAGEHDDPTDVVGNTSISIRLWRGDTDHAIEAFARIADRRSEHGVDSLAAIFRANVSMAMTSAARFDEAAALARYAHRDALTTGNAIAISWSLWTEGYALAEPDPATAVDVLERALLLAQEEHVTWVETNGDRALAEAYSRLGEHEQALDHVVRSVRTCRRQGAWANVWNYMMYVAMALEGLGDVENAARLLGGVTTSAVGRIEKIERLSAEMRARLGDRLGDRRRDELMDEGSRLTVADAADLTESAVADLDDRGADRS